MFRWHAVLCDLLGAVVSGLVLGTFAGVRHDPDWLVSSPGGELELVRAAALASLAARGVRVHRATAIAVEGIFKPLRWEDGVAQPATRSARVRSFTAEDEALTMLGDAILRRWPGLVSDDQPPEPGPRPSGESIQIDRTVYYGDEGRWIDWSDLPVYTPSLVLWGLEAGLGMSVVHTGARQVRRRGLCGLRRRNQRWGYSRRT